MPQYLGKLIEDGDVQPSKLRVVVYDEADLALEETPPKDLQRLFQDDEEEREYTRLTFLVGASVTPSLGNLAVGSKLLPAGQSYISTATRFAALDASSDSSSAAADHLDSDHFNVVASAANGKEAIDIFREINPDVVTMDLTMPKMDGVECIEKLVALKPDILILVTSALSDKATGIEALEKGARGFLCKPFTDEDLIAALMELTE